MKKELASHIQYSGWKYFAILIVAIIFWGTVFTALAQPKPHEKVSITCFVDQVDVDLLSDQLNSNRENITNQKLKEISAESILSNDSFLSILFSTRKMSSDLIIIGESSLNAAANTSNAIDPRSFVPFSVEKLQQLLSGRVEYLQFYYVEEYAVGIYLNSSNKEETGRFSDYYNGNDRCVVFFSNESVNLGGLYNVGESTNYGALDVLVYLLTK